MAFSLPRLKYDLAIVDPATGKPTRAFENFINQQILNSLEGAIITINQNVADLQAAYAAIQAVSTVAQAAQQTANQAQEAADAAGGGTALSGSATAVVSQSSPGWQNGPQVDLAGVAAGNLTISGSGPQQNDGLSSVASITGDYRIVEIVGMVETTVFTGTFLIYEGSPSTVLNQSAAAVSSFSSARASTGAVSYRLDAQRTDGGPIVTPIDLELYLFVRRA